MYDVNRITPTRVQALKYCVAILMIVTILALGFFIGTAIPAQAVEAAPAEPTIDYQQMYQDLQQVYHDLQQVYQTLQQESEADQQIIQEQNETICNLTQELESAKAENKLLTETFGTAYYVVFEGRRNQQVFPSENIFTITTQVSKETYDDLEFGDQLPLTTKHFSFPSNTNNVTWTLYVVNMYTETVDLTK